MLKVLDETIDKTAINVIFDKCGIEQVDINSLVIQVKRPIPFNIVYTNTSTPSVGSMLNDNYAVTSRLTSFSLTGDDVFQDGVYEFDYFILYNNSHNISANKGQNEITATDILNDFLYYDSIYIGNRIYTIDKQLSSQDIIVLTEPLEEDAVTYKIPKIIDKGFFVLYRDYNNWLVTKINQITNCVACHGKITNMTQQVTYLLGLVHNIECQDLDGATTIFNYLKQIQADDNCC